MISIKSPTRVDLAGGTLDMWPLYNFTKEAQTINFAISIFTQADISDSEAVVIESADLKKRFEFPTITEFLASTEPLLSYYQCVVEVIKVKRNFKLVTSSQSPVGGGLGGSSSLLVSILKAFLTWENKSIPETVTLVSLAHNIESQILKTPTGTQDYFPAISGGINLIKYSAAGMQHEILTQGLTDLEKHFILVYTGKSHHSGLNNFDVLTRAVKKDAITLGALLKLKKISDEVVDCIKLQKLGELSSLFRSELEARLELAPSFSSPEIETLHKLSLQAGADALKICGAGGGGCVMLWLKPAVRERVASECQKAGFEVLPAQPVPPFR